MDEDNNQENRTTDLQESMQKGKSLLNSAKDKGKKISGSKTLHNKSGGNVVEKGAKVVCGGKREDAYYYPTILDNVTKDMEVAKDMEIFGPVISVIGFDTVEEAIEIANQEGL